MSGGARQFGEPRLGMFVTSLYAAAAFAGSLMGWIEANHGWPMAGVIQMSVLSIVWRGSRAGAAAQRNVTVGGAVSQKCHEPTMSVLQDSKVSSAAGRAGLSAAQQRAAVICGCIVAFAYSANYTNHAPLAPALMREFGFNQALAGC